MSLRKKIITYILLGIFSVFFLMPVYVLLSTSFKSFQEVSMQRMWFLPRNFSLSGIVEAFNRLGPNLKNSFFLVIPASLISAAIGSINGYILSKVHFKGSNLLFSLILFGMFIPYQSILFPLISFLQDIGLYGSLWGLIVTHIIYGLPITTLIFRNYYAEVPNELIEAAHIDGAGLIKAYIKVMLPISIPGFVVVMIWQFTNIWNEFLFAVTVTNDPSIRPITVALVNLAGSQVVHWNVQMSGAIIAALPTLIVYIILGKYFLRGLLAGSVKA
ncbi:MAG: carbohydrate ABC transporter permease [Petrotogales bacterium]